MNEINKIHQMDCIQGMKGIHDNSVDLIVTSPPYNIGKEYEKVTDINSYLSWSKEYLKECFRCLKEGRSFFLEVGCYLDKNRNNIPLTYLLYPLLKEIGFNLRQEVVWHFKGGMQAKKKLTGQNEKILWLYKGDNLPYFNLDAVRVKEWKAIDKRNNPNGKNPTDVWEINRVTGNSKEKVGHPCQFPVEMIQRILKGWSQENEIVLDPFIGSGTTAEACMNTHRRYIGFELDKEYHRLAECRIHNLTY
ncbi:DNA-methyltransferase [Rossellomorea marisflavi]|uniref:DNA-methyltransferase n=1 Tax=Rossellomorea marisflavi TaxID=189381 RepID=UPI003F9F797D